MKIDDLEVKKTEEKEGEKTRVYFLLLKRRASSSPVGLSWQLH